MSNEKIEAKEITVSSLGKTWLFDLDGTVVKHNGYLTDGKDTLLDGAKEFFAAVPPDDTIVFLTSRSEKYAQTTEAFLKENGIRYNSIVYGLPYGERILVNDCKPSGLKMAVAVNTKRDTFMHSTFKVDENL